MTLFLWFSVGIFGSTGIAVGALGAHGLEGLGENQLSAFETATRYHLIHVLAAAISLILAPRTGRLALAATSLFLFSIVLFSGSIYMNALTGFNAMLAPFGGSGFMVAWFLLGWSGCRLERLRKVTVSDGIRPKEI